MKKVLIFFLIISTIHNISLAIEYSAIYAELSPKNNKPSVDIFGKAMIGFEKLKSENRIGNTDIITIIDLSLPSTKRRLWIIDLKQKKVVENSLVAHGKNSGQLNAKFFSNTIGSYQSSLGFYITGKTYYGKHGLSLYLNGVETAINDKAKERAIVIHGAPYVSQEFIDEYGRLGRSFGCPAVPVSKHKTIIDRIKNGSCLFIYFPDKYYLNNSQYITSIGD
ncbi:murein L,D-transpeptidase catalytic domain family protein [Draconibacterium sp.]|uniref:murein L,D-transpeptidase catalytic domain family protein n=1 Tax=Draconibacterium sp. TaxID=1965318 RepID=UPI003567EF8A